MTSLTRRALERFYFSVFNTAGFFTIYETPEITVRITAAANSTSPMTEITCCAVPGKRRGSNQRDDAVILRVGFQFSEHIRGKHHAVCRRNLAESADD